MGKKGKRSKDEFERVGTEGAGNLTHNPFAALQGAGAGEGPAGATTPEPDRAASPPEDSARSGGPEADRLPGKIVLRRETRGRGGKTVTRVEGLPADRREELAQRMKKGLGCGAKVEGDTVLLLGSLVDRAAEWLERQGARRVVKGN
ncbi:MAG: translation initiation factor [Polyangiales bacterium]